MDKQLDELPWTGERLTTNVFNEDTIFHLHRYAIATKYIKDKVVLDIASGEGYGTNLLSKNACKVYGVDISKEAVDFSRKKYPNTNIEFIMGSIEQIPMPDNSLDVVVSFETIEHVNNHDLVMKEIKRIIKPKGLLIISSPVKNYGAIKNQYHLKELTTTEFQKLLRKYFNFNKFYSQQFFVGSLIEHNMDTTKKKRIKFEGDFLNIVDKTEKDTRRFNIAIASDRNFNTIDDSYFDGKAIYDESLIKPYKNSKAYRLSQSIKKLFRIYAGS